MKKREVVVALIGHATAQPGLRNRTVLDGGRCPRGSRLKELSAALFSSRPVLFPPIDIARSLGAGTRDTGASPSAW